MSVASTLCRGRPPPARATEATARSNRAPDRSSSLPTRAAPARRARADSQQRRQDVALEMIEVMRLAEEARDVGRQRREHLQPLVRAVGAADEIAIIAEVSRSERAQPLGQARIDELRLRLPSDRCRRRRGSAPRSRRKSSRLSANSPNCAIRRRRRRRRVRHAAASISRRQDVSSTIRPIMRPSTASMPRTKDLTQLGRHPASDGSCRRNGQDLGHRIDQQAHDLRVDLDDDDDVALRRLGLAKLSRCARSTIGSTDAAQIDDAAHISGACGSAVAGVQPRISRTDMMSTQNSCAPTRKAMNSRAAAGRRCATSVMASARCGKKGC